MRKRSATLHPNRKWPANCCSIFFTTLSMFLITSSALLTTYRTCAAEEFAGKLIFSEGSVLFSLDRGSSWSEVTPLMAFPEGAYIKTGSDGEAGLILNDRSQIRMAAGSVLYLKKSGSAPKEINRPGLIEIFSGKLWFRNKRRGSKPVFETAVISASIRGTEMAISVADDGIASITVLEGQVKCSNSQGEAIITRGEGVTAQKGAPPIITKLIRPERSVQWLLLTPEITGPADADIIKYGDVIKGVSVEINGIKRAQKAMELLVQGEDGALQTAYNAVFLAPDRASTHVALATALQSKGKFEEALKEAELAQILDPLSLPALIRTVELLLGLDKVDRAENLISSFRGVQTYNNGARTDREGEPESKTAAQAKVDVRVLTLKGYMALINLDSKRGELLFRAAIEQKRELASAYLGLGLALYHQRRIAEGLENMEKACLLEPLAAYPHTYLAKALYQLGERYEAEIELRRAAMLDPYDPTPHMYLATILTDTYRPGEGIKALEKSISLNDNQLMTRSRYLLDQDRASKNISLAWSLTTMGLYEWAAARGDQAVWDDESNSSGYLFRAARAQILGQLDADTIGDMKRADLLKPVNANSYTSYSDYQNLLETPEIRGTLMLNGGTDKTGYGSIDLRGGDIKNAFHGSVSCNTTDGAVDSTGKSSSDGMVSMKRVVASGHEVLAQARTLKGESEDLAPWQDSRLTPENTERDYDQMAGALGYHWHQGAGADLMALLQSERYESDSLTLYEKYISPVVGTQFDRRKKMRDSDTWRAEMVQLFRVASESAGDHSISCGISQSHNGSSLESEAALYYDPPFNEASTIATSNVDNPDKIERHLFIRDIWSLSDTIKLDTGMAWCDLDNIVLNGEGEYEHEDRWLPHLGLIWRMSPVDRIRGGYFKEIEPDYMSGTLQPVEMAGFSRIFGSAQGTLTEFYGAGWDREWSSQIFTRAEVYHKNREFPDTFSSHAGDFETIEEELNLSWKREREDSARVTCEYLVTDRLAMAITYQLRDHNTDSGIERNRIDNDLGAIFTWVHPSGVRIQNSWWYISQDEGSGYTDPVDHDFVIAGITLERAIFDKRVLLVAKWENIFDEKYSYLISDTTESSQLPWQGSFASLWLQWNF